MKPKKVYKRIAWKTALDEGQTQSFNWVEVEPTSDLTRRRVVCKVCKVALWESINHQYWLKYWHIKEQRHEDSEEHAAGLLLQKLSGD